MGHVAEYLYCKRLGSEDWLSTHIHTERSFGKGKASGIRWRYIGQTRKL